MAPTDPVSEVDHDVRLLPARFLARPNRFIVRARLDGGDDVEAHLADPGRLKELLVPGAELRLRPAAPGAARRTRFGVALVRAGRRGCWVSVETTRANRLAESILADGLVRGVGRGWSLRREVPRGNSRFDFLLEKGPTGRAQRTESRVWVEVKSATLVEGATALFPDAPTLRGTRHLTELTEIARCGDDGALVLFVVQRGDAGRVKAHREIDPAFAAALDQARSAGVLIRAAAFSLDGKGRSHHLGPLPVR